MLKISFVIIGRNEANNILKCIESIRKIYKESTYEIIFIDSNSTDNTLEMLREEKYDDILKYQIKSNRYSAALARSVGASKASGQFLFFIDADMELKENTDISFCLNLFKDSNVGVVSGELNEVWIKDNNIINTVNKMYNVKSEMETLKSPGGYFITKKQLYDRVGGFNIDLKCNEEVDLFSRYKKYNKKLIRTNKLLCLHNNEIDSESKLHFTRFKSKYYVDFWRTITRAIKGGYLKQYISFKAQTKMLRSIFLTAIMILCIILGFKYKKLLILPIIYFGMLTVKHRDDFKVMIFNQINNIFVFFSIIYLFKKIKVQYTVVDLKKGE